MLKRFWGPSEPPMTIIKRLDNALAIAESDTTKSEALAQLNTLCHKLSIPVTVIGGMAVAAHGYRRFTEDVDILIKRDDAQSLANTLLRAGWSDIGQNKLKNTRTNIVLQLCGEGVRAGRTVFPAPDHSEPGVTVASLPLLLILKVKANRHKDRTDVVELIKRNQLSEQYIIDNVTPHLAPIDQKSVLALWQTAKEELGTTWTI